MWRFAIEGLGGLLVLLLAAIAGALLIRRVNRRMLENERMARKESIRNRFGDVSDLHALGAAARRVGTECGVDGKSEDGLAGQVRKDAAAVRDALAAADEADAALR